MISLQIKVILSIKKLIRNFSNDHLVQGGVGS